MTAIERNNTILHFPIVKSSYYSFHFPNRVVALSKILSKTYYLFGFLDVRFYSKKIFFTQKWLKHYQKAYKS